MDARTANAFNSILFDIFISKSFYTLLPISVGLWLEREF